MSNGIEATRQIRELKIPVKVVILTMHNAETVMKRAQDMGAEACRTKTCGSAYLIETIKTVLQKR